MRNTVEEEWPTSRSEKVLKAVLFPFSTCRPRHFSYAAETADLFLLLQLLSHMLPHPNSNVNRRSGVFYSVSSLAALSRTQAHRDQKIYFCCCSRCNTRCRIQTATSIGEVAYFTMKGCVSSLAASGRASSDFCRQQEMKLQNSGENLSLGGMGAGFIAISRRKAYK